MFTLAVIALATVTTAAVAMSLRNIIHCALLLVASWAGIASFYLWADAEFVAFAQLLVYVGAVSMIVLFAVLLTRRSREGAEPTLSREALARTAGGLIVAGATFGVLAAVATGFNQTNPSVAVRSASVRQIGIELMGTHAAAVLIVGLILTVALIGAIVLASTDTGAGKGSE